MNPAFEVHELAEEGFRIAQEMAGKFDELLSYLTGRIPAGRELSNVTTKLEEACFFAKKGMARDRARSSGDGL